jgi:hypothetical protein
MFNPVSGMSGAAEVQAASVFALSWLPDEQNAKSLEGAAEAGPDGISTSTRCRHKRSRFYSFIFCENYCVH